MFNRQYFFILYQFNNYKTHHYETPYTSTSLGLGSCLSSQAQLYIDNATFFIETGATVTVQGDLTSNVSIQGPGKILLKGTALQNVNMNNGGAATNAYTIPNLEIDNTSNVALTGNAKVGTSLLFTNGKVQLGNFNFVMDAATTVTGCSRWQVS